jgi:hypothetical protein
VVLHRLQCAKPGRNEPLDRLILATANRDFSILLIGLAVIGRLEWFVWLMGILVHVFWLTALWLSLPARSSPRTGST